MGENWCKLFLTNKVKKKNHWFEQIAKSVEMDIVRFLPDLSVYIYMQIVIFSWSPHILLSPVCICRCFKLFLFFLNVPTTPKIWTSIFFFCFLFIFFFRRFLLSYSYTFLFLLLLLEGWRCRNKVKFVQRLCLYVLHKNVWLSFLSVSLNLFLFSKWPRIFFCDWVYKEKKTVGIIKLRCKKRIFMVFYKS